MYVQYSFLDNRYRTTLLSFHLNRNLISKVASRFLLFTLFCITYLHRREMNPIGFLFQFFIPYQMPHNLKCINFECVAVSFIISFSCRRLIQNRPYPDNKEFYCPSIKWFIVHLNGYGMVFGLYPIFIWSQ